VPDRDAPEFLNFIIAAPTLEAFYKDGVAYAGIDLPLIHQGELWVGQLSLVPIQGMALSARNAADTDGFVVDPPIVSGTPPPDYPVADSGEWPKPMVAIAPAATPGDCLLRFC
jgi:hypothetical protein